MTVIEINKQSPKLPRKRCAHNECKKKLKIVEREIVCVCGGCFCTQHRLPEAHNCKHDFTDCEERKEKKCESLKCVASKVIKI